MSSDKQVITVPSASPEVTVGEGTVDKVDVSIQQQQQQQATGIPTGGRMVVAKPLPPNQTLPASIRTNLVSLPNQTCESQQYMGRVSQSVPGIVTPSLLSGMVP